MGTTACFVAASPGAPRMIRDAYDVASIAGWTFYKPAEDWVYPSALEQITLEAARAHQGLAIGAFVEDSDVSYMAAATIDSIVARILFGREGALDYAEGSEALDLIGPDLYSGPDAFELWSVLAGSRVPAAKIRELLETDWVYKEEPLEEVFKGLGIPLPYDSL